MTGASRRIIQPALCAGRAVLTNTSVPCQRRRLRPAASIEAVLREAGDDRRSLPISLVEGRS